MANSNLDGVLLKAEEPKVIKIPNFSKLHSGYVEGSLHLQDTALQTLAVRVFPCGRQHRGNKEYVSLVFKKLWLRTFTLNFHCTVSIIEHNGDRKYSQTYGMEELEKDFEIDQFVRRSTLFENNLELLPNDTLTVLCEVSYTMPSSQRSSKIWSVLNRLYAWYPPKTNNFSETQGIEETCSLVVETMDKGEFLLSTPLSYFKVETGATESFGDDCYKNTEEPENSKESIACTSVEKSVKQTSIEIRNSSKTNTIPPISLDNINKASAFKNDFNKKSKTSNKNDFSSLISDVSLACGKKDISGLISSVTAVLANANLSEKSCKKPITKGFNSSHTNDSQERNLPAFGGKTFFGTDYRNKTLSKVPLSDPALFSRNRKPDLKRGILNTGTDVKKIKSKSEANVVSNTKILDLGSRKIIKGSDVCDASPVFRRMLKTPMLENATKRVRLRNVDVDTFDNFLCYLETRKIIAATFEKLCDLYEMADQFEVMDLFADCGQHMFQSLDVNNFLTVLELAEMHIDDKLQKKVHKFFQQNERDVLFQLQNEPKFLKWYSSWKRDDISPDIDTSDDEVEVIDNDLDFYR